MTGRSIPKRPTEKKSVVTRRQLLKAGSTLLETSSIIDIRIEDIVKEAGVSIGTFYIYFSDKYDMFRQLLHEIVDRGYEKFTRLEYDRPRIDRIRAAVRANLEDWQQHGGILASLHQLSLSHVEFSDFLEEELRRPFTERLKEEIESSIARGYARPIDAGIAADVVGTLLSWTFMRWIGMDRMPYDDVEVDHLVDTLALLWYRALYAADPPEA